MRRMLFAMLFMELAVAPLPALRKPHVVSFGKWQTVKRFADVPGPALADPQNLPGKGIDMKGVDLKGSDLKIRSLYVDAQLKENTTGLPHEITDRIFVGRRAFPVYDSPPGWEGKGPAGSRQLGG